MNYKRQLANQLWINKRNEILERDNHKCVICGCKDNLQVHHKEYIYNRKAWEYDNDNLITLCKSCHYKEHGLIPKDDSISSKNFVVYRSLMKNNDFTPNERILYSIFCAFALYKNNIHKEDWYEYKVDNVRQLCKTLNITTKTFYRTKKSLLERGLISDKLVYVPKKVAENGFIKLVNYNKISGELLIFYSYIKSKSKIFGNVIDTYKSKLATELNTTKIAITKLLNRLYEIGLAKRLDNGKLLIL